MADLHVQIDPSTYFLRSSAICIISRPLKCTQPSLTNPAEFSPIRVILSVFGLFRDWSTIIISSVFELAAAADQHVEELIVKRVGAAAAVAAVATYSA